MHLSQVIIKGVTYNMAQAPAVDQVRLINLLGARLIQFSELLQNKKDHSKYLLSMLTALPNEIVQQVSQIVLYKTFVHGKESIPVDVESFQGKPMQYLQLLAEGILVNTGDYFEWLASETKEAVSPDQL